MSLQSIDLLKPGDWIVCEAGPKVSVRPGPFGGDDVTEKRDREWEGLLANVIAINPPIILLEVYDLNGRFTRPKFSHSMNFYDAAWGRANEVYRENYLARRKERTKNLVEVLKEKDEEMNE